MGDTEFLHDNSGTARMRQASIFLVVFLGLPTFVSNAQTTITDRSLDVTVGNGLWGVFLPGYGIGNDGSSSEALGISGESLGYQGDLRVVKRFLHTRTNIEARAFYGVTQSSDASDVDSLTLANPNGNSPLSLGQGRAHLQSDLDHYGYDLGLRDTWRTRIGGLSAGCLLSYMIFDQSFDTSHQSTLALSEELSSEFIGGKATFGWDGYIRDCPSLLDLSLGFYQLRTDYVGRVGQLADAKSEYRYANPFNLEASFTTYKNIKNVRVGSTFSLTHLGKMPYLIRDGGLAPTIDHDDGLMLKLMFEILL